MVSVKQQNTICLLKLTECFQLSQYTANFNFYWRIKCSLFCGTGNEYLGKYVNFGVFYCTVIVALICCIG